jgi:hypothetical protein
VRFLHHVAHVRLFAAAPEEVADEEEEEEDGAHEAAVAGSGALTMRPSERAPPAQSPAAQATYARAKWGEPSSPNAHSELVTRMLLPSGGSTWLWYRGTRIPAGSGCLNLMSLASTNLLLYQGPPIISTHTRPRVFDVAPTRAQFDKLTSALPLAHLKQAAEAPGPRMARAAAGLAALKTAGAVFGVQPEHVRLGEEERAAAARLSVNDAWDHLYFAITLTDWNVALIVTYGDPQGAPPPLQPPPGSDAGGAADGAFTLVQDGNTGPEARPLPRGARTPKNAKPMAPAARWYGGADVGSWYADVAASAEPYHQCGS